MVVSMRNLLADASFTLLTSGHRDDPQLTAYLRQSLRPPLLYLRCCDLNDDELLAKLFDIAPFSHILHLATQTGVRYAIQNPQSYVKSNIAGFINLLEIAKNADPQPSIVWASSSSVYGLNTENPFSESRVAGGEQRK
ncbi:UDP-glucuronate 4-epimerase 6-like [Lactuca sativa]|uniref:UDP-glucuronate 4-epimerase 6-like n=1 Tax=Lactuca sativa TaxID=4236 RepID=UPI0022AF71E9|nr:UDP-glucuronate 4-epimerase 6-like [Lactuca sativa]